MVSKKAFTELADLLREHDLMFRKFNLQVIEIFGYGCANFSKHLWDSLYFVIENGDDESYENLQYTDREFLVGVVSAIVEDKKRQEDYAKLNYEFFLDYPCDHTEHLIRQIFELISAEYGEDAAETLSWWLWDVPDAGRNPEFALWENDQPIPTHTVEQIVDFILEARHG